jgi:hypothetical protein
LTAKQKLFRLEAIHFLSMKIKFIPKSRRGDISASLFTESSEKQGNRDSTARLFSISKPEWGLGHQCANGWGNDILLKLQWVIWRIIPGDKVFKHFKGVRSMPKSRIWQSSLRIDRSRFEERLRIQITFPRRRKVWMKRDLTAFGVNFMPHVPERHVSWENRSLGSCPNGRSEMPCRQECQFGTSSCVQLEVYSKLDTFESLQRECSNDWFSWRYARISARSVQDARILSKSWSDWNLSRTFMRKLDSDPIFTF